MELKTFAVGAGAFCVVYGGVQLFLYIVTGGYYDKTGLCNLALLTAGVAVLMALILIREDAGR